MALTADIILNRCKVNSLESVKSLQCWGMKFNDVSILNNAVNLEVLNLSCNNISSLKQIESCKSLRQVYLRKNKISDISELQHLQSLHNLQVSISTCYITWML
jgi:Leucine-rich repeat (LRR) protein